MKNVRFIADPAGKEIADRFLHQDLSERPFVVFTYYSWDKKPLYVGCSKDFIGANNNITDRKPEMYHRAVYVGFVFLESEEEIKAKKKYYIRARNPECNGRKEVKVPLLEGFGEDEDDVVFTLCVLEKYWQEQIEKRMDQLLLPSLPPVDYGRVYDDIVRLQAELIEDRDDPLFAAPDCRKVKALAATYELQDYLTDRIALANEAVIEQLLARGICGGKG